MSKLKVLHVVSGLGCGGAENMLLRLAKFQKSEGIFSTIISLSSLDSVGKKLQSLGIEVIYLGGKPGRLPSLRMVSKFISAVRKLEPDVVQGWMYHGNIAASFSRLVLPRSVPIIWNIRQSLGTLSDERPLTRFVILLGAVMSPSTKGIVYNSRSAVAQHEKIGYRKNRTIFIPNGFDREIYSADLGRRAKVESSEGGNLRKGRFVIGHAARFHPKKGHDVLFTALKQVLDQGWDVQLVAVGRSVEASNRMLRRTIPQDIDEERYQLSGEEEDMAQFYSKLDLFVSSSKWGEGFPNVIAEAMMNGIVCVGTDVGESKSLIGNTGIVVPPNDSKALAEGIISVFQVGAERRSGMGMRAAKRISSEFGIAKIGHQYLNLYIAASSPQ
jgi:glycosyltransferase involved in cell wall biosynthesis